MLGEIMNILVTGASGFVGRALISRLETEQRHHIVGSVRKSTGDAIGSAKIVSVGDISEKTDWTSALENIDVIIHLAGRAHVLNGGNNLSAFNRVNVDGTMRLAEQALEFGVKRFIFISSIGVNGSQTHGEAFTECSALAPHATYAESKRQAEEQLRAKLENSTMELVVIRPPLIYAANAPGNFQRLLKLVASGMPLPFGITRNKRSMVSLNNLIEFIFLCIDHPAAANETFLISDGVSVSTKEIVRLLAEGMEMKARLFPFPDSFARLAFLILRKPTIYTQLYGSLVIDSSKARTLLGWVPIEDASRALKEAGCAYKRPPSNALERSN
jgi:nucleoside-diphosphate-sugar epimerase